MTHRSVFVTCLTFAAAAVAPRPAAAESGAAFASQVKPFLAAHCVDCHGEDVAKAGLRLDNLPADFGDERTAATWATVFDKLSSGTMPPKSEPRPPKPAVDAATQFLGQHLHAASLARQQEQGRVIVRRLNGTEYQNTIHDLLNVRVPLKDMLPEDGAAAGFDNVSSALDLSATHLLLYQQAAEKAINAAIPVHPPVKFSDRRTGREITAKGPNFKQTLTRSAKLEGDALILYSQAPRYGLCSTTSVPTAGRYRVQMSACAVGAGVKAIPVGLCTIGQGREGPVVFDVRDIPAGKPAVIEFEVDLNRSQGFVVNLLTHWDIRTFKKPLDEYTGPGLLVEWLSIEGPVDAFPPPSYDRLFAGVPLKAKSVAAAEAGGRPARPVADNRTIANWYADPLTPVSAKPKEDAERLIRDFLPRAFRRPVNEELQKHFVRRVHEKLDQKFAFVDAMTYGYKSILASAHFLLLVEPGAPAGADKMRLDDYALASRLSYFLWSTAPDDALLALAARNELSRPDVLRAQVERLLADPKARRFTENFTGQWLDLRKIDATIPDPQLYGDFDPLLLWAMPRETRLFFDEILRHDRSLLEFVHSDWTILNARLARLYGIPGVEGNAFRKVALPPDSHRGGVMTQASVCKVTADGTRTSPVLRGKWVLEKILGTPPAPPPADVPAIEPDIRGATTIRQQLDKHRNTPACATCHVHIDPPGFALETFDPIGNWRDFYRASARTKAGVVTLPNYTGSKAIFRGPDVEKGFTTPDGRAFADVDAYKRILLENPDQIARNLTQKLLTYATGADVQFADREVVEQIVARLRAGRYGLRTLVHEVVQSRPFTHK
ncbi:MAG TPA: DUF1592 domain-containing protein [Tepidisphaeraceae bacterium]|nr:DUF1592 domain-containing protein [Tepidisphaeraceae bacterium]